MKTVILTVVITLLVMALAAETVYIYRMKTSNRKEMRTQSRAPRAAVVTIGRPYVSDDHYRGEEWDPFAEMDRIQSQMNRLFRSSLTRGMLTQPALIAGRNSFYEPDTDFEETPTAYIARLDLPGMEKEKIGIEVKNNMLTVSGERSSEREEKGPDQFYSKERSFGSFSRAMALPADAKGEGVTAQYKEGVLVVTIPRQQGTTDEKDGAKKIPVR